MPHENVFMTEQAHPSNDLLTAFLNGRLRQRQVVPITAHLEACDACADRLAQLESVTVRDAFLQQVRQAVLTNVDDETSLPNSGRWPAFLHDHPRFQVHSLISHGSSGPVYLATDRSTSQRVALKLIPAEPGSEQRLRQLCELLKAHARVIPTLHVEPVGSELLIANEYRAGVTLREVVCSRGRLTVAEVIPYAQQAAEALTLAHAQGVTHGDLRPTDWMLGEAGIAIRGWDHARCRHEVRHDPRADVAGFGRTIFGLLVGQTTLTEQSRLPFEGLWNDTPRAVVAVLKAMTVATYATPREGAEALTNAAAAPRWWHRWNPLRS